VSVGVIVVLVFNLFKSLFVNDSSAGAYLHIVEGNVQLKTWGTEAFLDLGSDAVVYRGDEIKTSNGAKVIMEFPDGTVMRIGGGSDLVLEEMDTEDAEPSIEVVLVDGALWFNKVFKNTATTDLAVEMSNVTVHSTGATVFEVENDFDEIVRVFSGETLGVDVKDSDEKVVDTVDVAVGQEATFTEKVLQRFWQHQSPGILVALSDEFKEGDWYQFNLVEDKNPTEFVINADNSGQFVVKEPEVLVTEEVDDSEEVDEETDTEESPEDPVEDPEEEEEQLDLGPLGTPAVISVSGGTQLDANGFYVVKGNPATLYGSIEGAEKVVVNNYTLQRFSPGDTNWTYYANADFDLMQPGENSYDVYAVAPDGTKSATVTVKVYYDPPQPVAPEEPEEVPVEVEEESG